jgi:hypothetical protein
MKKIMILLAVIGMFGFQGCTGPEGMQGPAGPPGQDGLIADVIEITGVSFTTSNNFGVLKTFNTPIYSSDVVLVYRLSGIDNGTDVWKLLPETYYFDDGTRNFTYNFDFTRYDVNIVLQGNDLQSVSDDFRINQIFRIVVVPAALINAIDKNNYNAVISALNINENQVQKIDLQK